MEKDQCCSGHSCINQLIFITHDILNSLAKDLEVRGVSKAFVKFGMKD